MWSAKISFDAKNIAGEYAKKNEIKLLVTPLSWSYEKTGTIVTVSGIVFGSDKGKEGFFRDWRRDKLKRGMFNGFKRIKGGILRELEVNGNFFIGKVWETPWEERKAFNRNLIYSRPWMIDENGKQTIVIGAFKKTYLNSFITAFEKFNDVHVHYLRKEKVSNVAFALSAPDLTERQKWAMDLAVSKGYYEIPRKVGVVDLAKIGKVSFATFHGHLRKAERGLMPFWFGG